ncbi:MAG: T9SS type A sorting domain-containing protein [Bacteroidales bacterium]|jgi:hypothetical protein|nr:T9SS type A sorting domain-containing protein [Bacteroidales bacterium]
MKNVLKFIVLVGVFALWKQDAAAQDYWINEAFTGVSEESGYVQSVNTIPLSPGLVQMTRYYANFEDIEGICNDGKTSGCVLRIRGKKDGGYAQFTVADAGNIRIAIKAKSSSANRKAEILLDGVVVATYSGLDDSHCVVFDSAVNSSVPVTVTIQGGDTIETSPICVNRIQVTKYGNQSANNLTITRLSSANGLLGNNAVSGVIDDPTDPAKIHGVNFRIAGTVLTNINATASSSDQSIVSNANLILSRQDDSLNLKIIPVGTGSAVITLTLTEDTNTKMYNFDYWASGASSEPSLTTFHTGLSDASTSVAWEDDYFFTADDESNEIRLYNRYVSGMPIQLFDLGTYSNIETSEPEMDMEASVRGVLYPDRIYWSGSLGNSRTGKLRDSRNRLVVTQISGNGADAVLTYVSHYEGLRSKMIAWGDSHGYDFSSCAANNVIPKRIDGFNMEGMAIAPDSTSCYFGFRAPLVPAVPGGERKLAIIATVHNFEDSLANNTLENALIDEPLLLDLDGRSIRSIDRLKNGLYLIIAGMYDDVSNAALYIWSGQRGDTATRLDITFPTSGEVHPESFLEGNSLDENNLVVELISDNGTMDFYNTGAEAKTFDLPLRKFEKRTYVVPLPISVDVPDTFTVSVGVNNAAFGSVSGGGDYAENTQATLTATANQNYVFENWTSGSHVLSTNNPLVITVTGDTAITANFRENVGIEGTVDSKNSIFIYPNPVREDITIGGLSGKEDITLTDISGRTIYICKSNGETEVRFPTSHLANGMYFVRISSSTATKTAKVVKE